MKLNYDLIEDIQIDGIRHDDAPDYVDAFIANASYDGRPMTDDELDVLNEDSDYVYQQVMNKLY